MNIVPYKLQQIKKYMAIYDTTNMNVVPYGLQLIYAIYGTTKYELCTLQVATNSLVHENIWYYKIWKIWT